ncbi:MAG: hypothetical protein FWG16_08160, partial [Micrococcales bacterium]|nr:hypothetical protein [Micrococcales bacterium]
GRFIQVDRIHRHGLVISGARFKQRVELDGAVFPRYLKFVDCVFEAGVIARMANLFGLILDSCTISGIKDCEDTEAALDLTQASVVHNVQVLDSEVTGELAFHGARIGGQLSLKGSKCTAWAGSAVGADSVFVGGNVSLTGEFGGTGDSGVVRLAGAILGGQLHCEGVFQNSSGPALVASGAEIASDVLLNAAFSGSGDYGAVNLQGTNIGGELTLEQGQFRSNVGPIFYADQVTTKGDVALVGAFFGSDERGCIRLLNARIGGSLVCNGGCLDTPTSPALSLFGTEIEGQLYLPTAVRRGKTPEKWLVLDGLTYRGLPWPRGDCDGWIELLTHQTAEYSAQPWQQLASAYGNAGHDQDARRVRIAQQDARLKDLSQRRKEPSSNQSRLGRQLVAMRLSKRLVQYGWSTSRIWWWFLALVLAAIGLGLLTGCYQAEWPDLSNSPTGSAPRQSAQSFVTRSTVAAHQATAATPAMSCSTMERIGLGLDWAIPLISIAQNTGCIVNTSTISGIVITGFAWTITLVGWFLATWALAGYTGLVRRL